MPDETQTSPWPAEPAGQQIELSPGTARFNRADWWSFALTAAIAFAGYWSTLAPDVTLEWSGLMATGAAYAGVTMVPGYPVWTLYAWLFTKLVPFSNFAWRVAVGSAAASAFASGLVALMVSRGVPVLFEDSPMLAHLNPRQRTQLRCGCGMIAGLVLAFTGKIWGEAVIADFWALSLGLFAAVLFAWMKWMLAPTWRRSLGAGFFLLGLLLTSSQELIVTLPGLVVAVMLVDRKLGRDLALSVLPAMALLSGVFQVGVWIDFPGVWNWPVVLAFGLVLLIGIGLVVATRGFGSEWKPVLACAGCMFLGLAFCFYPALASMTTPPVNCGYPSTVEGFFHILRRGQFEKINPTTEIGRYLGQLWLYVISAGKEFGWPQLEVSLIPFCFLHRMSAHGRLWFLGLLVVWICAGPLMVAEYNPPPDQQAMGLIACYYMCSHVILAVWLGLGLAILGAAMTRPRSGE